jgi:hypothetical protein
MIEQQLRPDVHTFYYWLRAYMVLSCTSDAKRLAPAPTREHLVERIDAIWREMASFAIRATNEHYYLTFRA